jgi:hypothetical protein
MTVFSLKLVWIIIEASINRIGLGTKTSSQCGNEEDL